MNLLCITKDEQIEGLKKEKAELDENLSSVTMLWYNYDAKIEKLKAQ